MALPAAVGIIFGLLKGAWSGLLAIFPVIIRYFKEALIIVFVLTTWLYYTETENLKEDVVRLNTKIEISKQKNLQCKTSLKKQTESILALQEEKKKVDGEMKNTLESIERLQKETKKEVLKILTADTGYTCEENMRWMADTLRNMEWKK